MSRDRRVAAATLLVAAAVIVVTTTVSDAPAVDVPGVAEHDEEAFAELLERLDAADAAAWIVNFDFHRELDRGRRSAARLTEARRDGVRIRRDTTAAQVTIGDREYACTIVDVEVQCLERPPRDASLSTSEVLQVAVDTGAYVVGRLPSESIADEDAWCYRVFGAGGFLPALGAETTFCVAEDGVPLRARIVSVGRTDERVAVAVERDPPVERFEELLEELALLASADEPAGAGDG